LDWYGARCKDVADVINENAPGNCQLTSPHIQKDKVQASAEEITQVIKSELENAYFLVYSSCFLVSLCFYSVKYDK
jgi:hypothetical protein